MTEGCKGSDGDAEEFSTELGGREGVSGNASKIKTIKGTWRWESQSGNGIQSQGRKNRKATGNQASIFGTGLIIIELVILFPFPPPQDQQLF